MDNFCKEWRAGRFVDSPRYSRWTQKQKDAADREEMLLVRPSPTGNAICKCQDPEMTKWIADRLNIAATLEELAYDFAMGKTDGEEITRFVNSFLEA